MGRRGRAAERFEEYLEQLALAVKHADRQAPLRGYLTGLLLSGERKSVEPMAAKVAPLRVGATHQSLHHFVAKASWDDEALLRVARKWALPQLEKQGPVAAWVVDDTGRPKKGRHSVGVARQYLGQVGKQDNCQVAVSLSLVNDRASVPCAYRLYLPEGWARDAARRKAAGVPSQVRFQTKWEIALGQIDGLLKEGLAPAPVVADAGYGNVTDFREGLRERGLSYAVGINPDTSVWPPGQQPLPAKPYSGKGQPPKLLRRSAKH
jgi:SRSO17 transposase